MANSSRFKTHPIEQDHPKTSSVQQNMELSRLKSTECLLQKHESAQILVPDNNTKNKALPHENLISSKTMAHEKINTVSKMNERRRRNSNKKIFIISPQNRWKLIWDLLVFGLMVYMLFEVPYLLCLDVSLSPSIHHPADAVALFADCCFLVDIVVTFFTAYHDSNVYKLITNQRLIAKRYLKTWFWTDLITSVPTAPLLLILDNHKYLTKLPKVVRILKTARLLKIGRVLRTLSQWHQDSASVMMGLLEALKFLLISFFLAHLAGCLWIGVAMFERVGQEFHMNSWISRLELEGATHQRIYFNGLYWSVTTLSTVGYGDIHPGTDYEMGLTIFVMMMGTALFGYIIGNAATLMTSSNQSAMELRAKVARVSLFMAQRRLPDEMRQRIRSHFEYTWRRSQMYDEEGILQDLPWTLRTEVLLFIHKETIDTVPLLQSMGMDAVTMLSVNFKPMLACPEDVVIHEGFYGQEMYICAEGSLQELAGYNMNAANNTPKAIKNKLVVELRRFGKGDYFAEYCIALDLAHKHPATVKALELCDLFTIRRDHFASVGKAFPHIYKKVQAQCGQRYDKILQNISHTIRGANSRLKMPDLPSGNPFVVVESSHPVATHPNAKEEKVEREAPASNVNQKNENMFEGDRISERLRKLKERKSEQMYTTSSNSNGQSYDSQSNLLKKEFPSRQHGGTSDEGQNDKCYIKFECSSDTCSDGSSFSRSGGSLDWRQHLAPDGNSSSRILSGPNSGNIFGSTSEGSSRQNANTVSSLGASGLYCAQSSEYGTDLSSARSRSKHSRLADKYRQYQDQKRNSNPHQDNHFMAGPRTDSLDESRNSKRQVTKQGTPNTYLRKKNRGSLSGIEYECSTSDEGEKETPRLNPLDLSGSFRGIPLSNSFRLAGKESVKLIDSFRGGGGLSRKLLIDRLATTMEGSMESSKKSDTRQSTLRTIESSLLDTKSTMNSNPGTFRALGTTNSFRKAPGNLKPLQDGNEVKEEHGSGNLKPLQDSNEVKEEHKSVMSQLQSDCQSSSHDHSLCDVSNSSTLPGNHNSLCLENKIDLVEWGRLLPDGTPIHGWNKYKIYRRILTWKTMAQVKVKSRQRLGLNVNGQKVSEADAIAQAKPKFKPVPPPPKQKPPVPALAPTQKPAGGSSSGLELNKQDPSEITKEGNVEGKLVPKKPVPPSSKHAQEVKPAKGSLIPLAPAGLPVVQEKAQALSPLVSNHPTPSKSSPGTRSRENSKRSREGSNVRKNRSKDRRKRFENTLDDVLFQLNRLTDAQRAFDVRQERLENLIHQVLENQATQKRKKSL